MNLNDLGWSDFFASAFAPYRDFIPARVVREHDKGFLVWSESGESAAQLSGRSRADGVRLAVGDWVALRPDGVIEAVLPRRSHFTRKTAGAVTQEQPVAANVDTLFLVSGLDRDFNVRRIERYLTVAWDGGAAPVILLNKADLCDDVDSRVAETQAVAAGAPVHPVSALHASGLEPVRARLVPGHTAAFLGSSGVGKSALVNALLGEARQSTGGVREDDQRGRHTTTMRRLFLRPEGGLIIDTPGMRELQVWADADALNLAFPEIADASRSCRFRDCTHEHEPGCAIRSGVDEGSLPPERFDSFRRLRAEIASLERRKAKKKARGGRRPDFEPDLGDF